MFKSTQSFAYVRNAWDMPLPPTRSMSLLIHSSLMRRPLLNLGISCSPMFQCVTWERIRTHAQKQEERKYDRKINSSAQEETGRVSMGRARAKNNFLLIETIVFAFFTPREPNRFLTRADEEQQQFATLPCARQSELIRNVCAGGVSSHAYIIGSVLQMRYVLVHR